MSDPGYACRDIATWQAEEMLERGRELDRLAAAISAARGGEGGVAIVEGHAGIGKTRLVAAAAERARVEGMVVLPARGGELEHDLPFGVVRQLLEPPLLAAAAPRRSLLLDGAARLAAPALDLGEETGLADPASAALHGLYWLAANLAARQPLLIAVDDAHWADDASLRWLAYLARRLEGIPVLLLVARRSAEATASHGLVEVITATPGAIQLRPRPLSQTAVARLVGGALGHEADDEFVGACHATTGGNPFLVRELLGALESEGIAPTKAAARRVGKLGPEGVARSILRRLRALGPDAAGLAQAVAILGREAHLRRAAELSGIDAEAAAATADALFAVGILGSGRPLEFVHPIVRQAIRAAIPPAKRALRHGRAARLLADERAGSDPVASQLLEAEPVGDPWAVETLRAAARHATARGAPEAAVPLLERALAEPPPPAERGSVLRELGAAELRAETLADHTDPSPAETHLAAAFEAESDPHARALAALDLGDALMFHHRYVKAVEAFDRGITGLGDADRELALRLETHAVGAARLDLDASPLVAGRLQSFDAITGESPSERLIAGVLAIERSLAGKPAQEVAALAERAHEGGHPADDHSGPYSYIPLFAVNALLWADQLDRALVLLDGMIAEARVGGSARDLVIGLCWRGLAAHRLGRVAEAAGDLATAVEVAAEHGWGGISVTHALLAELLLDRGDVDGAEEALARAAAPDDLPGYVGWNWFLHARGLVCMAKGDFAGALDDLLRCGARQQRWGAVNPSVIAWRSNAALAHAALGQRSEARRLALEELSLARASQAPRAIGVALRAAGVVEGGDAGLEHCREAVVVLEHSPALLELARSLVELGGALRRAGWLADARAALRRALDLGHRLGALAVAEAARTELVATGARPRRPALTGADSLTPNERRVAEMAAAGLANRELAQALFVTEKTVAAHLTHAYAKLGIRSRAELADALGLADGPPPSVPTQPASVLTARERDVLRLVARGLTDAQVAEELVVSVRTVNAHLRSIYSKVDVRSRAAATRYALEHQLG